MQLQTFSEENIDPYLNRAPGARSATGGTTDPAVNNSAFLGSCREPDRVPAAAQQGVRATRIRFTGGSRDLTPLHCARLSAATRKCTTNCSRLSRTGQSCYLGHRGYVALTSRHRPSVRDFTHDHYSVEPMITTTDELDLLVEQCLAADCVAVDTEFVWERTYYPGLGLIQVAIEDDVSLIDTVAVPDLSAFGQVLSAPNVTKIIHDALQDLTILVRACGGQPVAIFDSRLAAGFSGMASTISLSGVVDNVLGIELDKGATRTDWLKRPLSERQLIYAADDVKYLCEIRRVLRERADERGLLEWQDAELRRYDDPLIYRDRPIEEQFERVKGAGGLSARERAVLRELTAWREQTARRRDRPRGHIIPDKALVDLARRQPRLPGELRGTDSLSPRAAQRYSQEIISATARGQEVPDSDCPQPPPRSRRRDELKEQSDALLQKIRQYAEAKDLDPALLGSRADITRFVGELMRGDTPTAEDHALMRGWRHEFIGREAAAASPPALGLFEA